MVPTGQTGRNGELSFVDLDSTEAVIIIIITLLGLSVIIRTMLETFGSKAII